MSYQYSLSSLFSSPFLQLEKLENLSLATESGHKPKDMVKGGKAPLTVFEVSIFIYIKAISVTVFLSFFFSPPPFSKP